MNRAGRRPYPYDRLAMSYIRILGCVSQPPNAIFRSQLCELTRGPNHERTLCTCVALASSPEGCILLRVVLQFVIQPRVHPPLTGATAGTAGQKKFARNFFRASLDCPLPISPRMYKHHRRRSIPGLRPYASVLTSTALLPPALLHPSARPARVSQWPDGQSRPSPSLERRLR